MIQVGYDFGESSEDGCAKVGERVYIEDELGILSLSKYTATGIVSIFREADQRLVGYWLIGWGDDDEMRQSF